MSGADRPERTTGGDAGTSGTTWHDLAVTSRPASAQHLRDLERPQAGDADVVQEPTEQPYGVRDCALRDPAGNLIRIQELA